MPKYKIVIEYEHRDGTSKEKSKLEPLMIEGKNFAAVMTSEQVAEAIQRLDTQMMNQHIDNLSPEAALEVVTSSAYLYSVQIYAAVEESLLS